jgi:hypothetical protein
MPRDRHAQTRPARMAQDVVAPRHAIDDEAGALQSRDGELCAKRRELAAYAESLTVTGSRIG